MKTRLTFLPAILFLFASCLEQLPDTDAVTPSPKDGDVVKVSVSASTPGYGIESDTKSKYSFDENATNNLCIGVYDKETDEKVAEQYGLSTDTKIEFDLIVGRTYMFVAVANHYIPYGSGSNPHLPSTYSGLIAENTTSSAYMSKGTMAGVVEHTINGVYGDRKNPQYSNVVIPLQRCYAKFRIKVNQAVGTNFTVKSIKLKQVNTTDFRLYQPEQSYRRTDGSENGEAMTTGDSWVAGTNDAPSDGYYILYCPENRMGTPASLANNTDPKNKNPETDANYKGKCTYIELVVEGTDPLNGTVTYKFYPGANNYNNFDIQRNTIYNITVTLSDNIYETTWRVDPQWDYNVSLGGTGSIEGLTVGKTQTITLTKLTKDGLTYSWIREHLSEIRIVDSSASSVIDAATIDELNVSYSYDNKLRTEATKIKFNITPTDVFTDCHIQLVDKQGKIIWTDTNAISSSMAEIIIKDNNGLQVYSVVPKIRDASNRYFVSVPDGINPTTIKSWLDKNGYTLAVKMHAEFCTDDYNCTGDEGILSAANIISTSSTTASATNVVSAYAIDVPFNINYAGALTKLYAQFKTNGPCGTLGLYNGSEFISIVPFGVDAFPITVELFGTNYLQGIEEQETNFVYKFNNKSWLVLDIITSLSSNYTMDPITHYIGNDRDEVYTRVGNGAFVHDELCCGKGFKVSGLVSTNANPMNAYSYKQTNTGPVGTIYDRYITLDGANGEYLLPCFPNEFIYKTFDELTIIDCQIRLSGTTVAATSASIPLTYQIGSKVIIGEPIKIQYKAQLWNGNRFLANSDGTTSSIRRVYHDNMNAQSIYDLIYDIKHSKAIMTLAAGKFLVDDSNLGRASYSSYSYDMPLKSTYYIPKFGDGADEYTKTFNYKNKTTDLNLSLIAIRNYWMKSNRVEDSYIDEDETFCYSEFAIPTGILYGNLHFQMKSGYDYAAYPTIAYTGTWNPGVQIPERTKYKVTKGGDDNPPNPYVEQRYGCYYDDSQSNPDGTSRGSNTGVWKSSNGKIIKSTDSKYWVTIPCPTFTLYEGDTTIDNGYDFYVYLPDGDFYD